MIALHADLLDFPQAPAWGETGPQGVRWRPGHWLLVGDDGRITGVQAEAPGPEWPREDYRGRLLLPGFIDTHVHGPQLDVIASWGAGLLDWLETYTFPAELRYANPEVDRLLTAGRSELDRAVRVELYAQGIELANGFSELTDAVEQRKRLVEEQELRRSLKRPVFELDEAFLDAVGRMPPSGGIAVGFDRVLMLMLEVTQIADVLLFPAKDFV